MKFRNLYSLQKIGQSLTITMLASFHHTLTAIRMCVDNSNCNFNTQHLLIITLLLFLFVSYLLLNTQYVIFDPSGNFDSWVPLINTRLLMYEFLLIRLTAPCQRNVILGATTQHGMKNIKLENISNYCNHLLKIANYNVAIAMRYC